MTKRSPAPAPLPSPERKRFGIYYTPPDFAHYLIRHTLDAVVAERFERLREEQGLPRDDCESHRPESKWADYWSACLAALRRIKVCDPSCGDGAFLVPAYEHLEQQYRRLAAHLRCHDEKAARRIEDAVPDFILIDNLHGVDVSPQAVEVTQRALALRSARPTDLAPNLVRGNSLVADRNVDPQALDWEAVFPRVFDRVDSGFDCIIGNPPWERLKLQEREFFIRAAPHIAQAGSAARRRQLIAALPTTDPELFARYLEAKSAAERMLSHIRQSGDFPLTARGDANASMLFAELARRRLAPTGRAGLLVPSGIATDNTTRAFFNELMESQTLLQLHDFENKAPVFAAVHRSFKFCVLVFGGSSIRKGTADFVFFARSLADLKAKNRHIFLSRADLALLNPNTHTCPVFRSRRDAALTQAIYRRVPILIDETRGEAGNPWGLRFVRMFDQTNDAELFHDAARLKELGCQLTGNRWTRGRQAFLPLYEAKMAQAYDHRAASVKWAQGNWLRQGQTRDTTLREHQNPEFVVQPRWWSDESEVARVCGDARTQPAYLCFKDVTSATNRRTAIAALIPRAAVANSAPLMIPAAHIAPRTLVCLLANWNSFALDFVARQKVGGLHLNFFIVNQLPLFSPEHYSKPCPWDKQTSLTSWISERVLSLTCTANDMKPFAAAADFAPSVHRWDDEERAALRAELDAAFFVLYGIVREDVAYILDTFAGLRGEELGFRSTTTRILEVYDRLLVGMGSDRSRRLSSIL